MSNQNSNYSEKRIAKNTLFLYARQLLLLIVSLYTVRVVLDVLGASDYGLYNVVGGVVLMFSFINAGMVQASQRFLSFELGKTKNAEDTDLRAVFSTIRWIHIGIALVTIILAETVGLWFVNTQLNIEEGRVVAANWVYQFSILTFSMSILSVPYNAMIIAYEKMSMYAYVSVAEAILKLCVAFLVSISLFDKLVFYSCLLFIVSLLVFIVLFAYCKNIFKTNIGSWVFDKNRYKSILGFAGWSFVGNIGFSLRSQGVNMLINIFFNTAVNAARGIAYNVSGIISQFANNFTMALSPQITKLYADEDRNTMVSLVYKGSRISYFLMLILSLPAIILAPYLLDWWLKEVPEYTLIFFRLAIIVAVIDSTAIPLGKGIDATGNNKLFQIVVAVIMLSDIPFSWCFLKLGFPPYIVFYVSIFTSFVALFARFYILKRNVKEVSFRSYFRSVLLKLIIVTLISLAPYMVMKFLVPESILTAFVSAMMVLLISVFAVYMWGTDKEEKQFLDNKFINRFFKCKL